MEHLGLSSHTVEVLLHCFTHDVLVRPPLLGSQRAEPDVGLAVQLQGQGDGFFRFGLSGAYNALLWHASPCPRFGGCHNLESSSPAVYAPLRNYVWAVLVAAARRVTPPFPPASQPLFPSVPKTWILPQRRINNLRGVFQGSEPFPKTDDFGKNYSAYIRMYV